MHVNVGHPKKLHKTPNQLIAAGLFSLICATSLLIWLQTGPTRIQMGATPILFSAWGLSVTALCASSKDLKSNIKVAVLLGVLVRVLFIGQAPLLSDDLYRYLWEGMALNHGYNPLTTTPDSIAHLNPALHGEVNHGTISSIYPPLALGWFRLIDWLQGGVVAAQSLAVIADCAVILGIWKIVTSRRSSTWPVWLYALHPLAVMENGWSAHIDGLAIAFAVWGVWAWEQRRLGLATALSILGIATKVFSPADKTQTSGLAWRLACF